MTGEYCCKDKKCCDNMEEEYDHHDMEDGENDDMEEEVYYHDIKTNEDDYDTKRQDAYHDMEDENIDDPKLKLGKNSSEKDNIVKEYSLEEHNTVKVNYHGRRRLPSIGRSLCVLQAACRVIIWLCSFGLSLST